MADGGRRIVLPDTPTLVLQWIQRFYDSTVDQLLLQPKKIGKEK